jgi:hypothetical protein
MSKPEKGSIVWLLLALVSLTIAALAFAGVILSRDMTGRLIYGILWTALSLSWIGRYVVARKKAEQTKRKGRRP